MARRDKQKEQNHTQRISSYHDPEELRHHARYPDGSVNEDATGTEPGSGEDGSYASRLREVTHVLHEHNISRGVTPEKLRLILEDLGPTYVKLGQLMSMRSDILPQKYCDELMKLHSEVNPMPFDEVIRVIENSTLQPWGEIFARIDEKPLGSASIAQVHRAQLVTGEEVVVKVQREGIYDTMKRDINLLHRAVKFVPNVIVKGTVDLDEVLDELWVVTQEEMNFQKEAANMEEFAELNKDVVFVASPRLYRQYTTGRVLVMEYIDGYDIDDAEVLGEHGYDLNEIGTKLIDNWIRQVMTDGFFHADPHPGNIMIRGGKIVWIDMGMMGRLSDHDRRAIELAIRGIAEGDNSRIEEAVLSIGKFRGTPDRKKLHSGIEEIMRRYGSRGLGDIDIAKFMQDLMDVMKENQIQMPHGLTLLARGLTQIEGVLARISPDVNMIEIARARVQEDFFRKIDWKQEFRDGGINTYRAVKNGIELPTMLAKILREYTSGQSRINLDLHASDELSRLMNHIMRHVNLGLWGAALLVSSAIICTTDMQPKLFGIPALGALGFMAAFAMVVFIIIKYIFGKK